MVPEGVSRTAPRASSSASLSSWRPRCRRPKAGRSPASSGSIFFSTRSSRWRITLAGHRRAATRPAAHLTNDALLRALSDLRPESPLRDQLRRDRRVLGRPLPHVPGHRPDGRTADHINLAFLFCIAALPFPTSVLAGQGDLVVAVVFYAAFGVVTGLASTLLWIYPVRAGLVSPTVTPDIAKRVRYRALVVPVVFAASTSGRVHRALRRRTSSGS